MTLRSPFAALAAGLLLALTALPSGAGAAKALKHPSWPQATSDLPADPQVRFGVLPNGLRYAIRKNATPTHQAALRLRLDAGSLMEADTEQGLAHYLEHMAFNGSRKVPEGEMIKILERHGLSFGADTNASTSWTETIYQLDLPSTDDDTVDTSLMLLREAGSELLLDKEAIDRERGVILSEERSRDTPGLRVFKEGLGFFLKDQLAPRRMPIGKVDVINGATPQLLRGFYSRYYQPERAVLVAVGDFELDAMEAKIKGRFGDWIPAAPDGAEPDLGKLLKRGPETKLVVEPGSPLSLQLEWTKPADRSKDTRAKRARNLVEQLGLAVLNRRLGRLARGENPPFIGAQAYKDDIFHSAEATIVTVSAQPAQWRAALAAADQEQRKLVQYGVRQDELDREIAEYRVQLQSAVAGAATRRTTRLADEIVGTLDDDDVYTDPKDELAGFEAAVKGLKAQTVSGVLKRVFSGNGPLLFMATPQAIEGGQAALAAAYAESRAKPVAAPDLAALKTWPYSDFGAPGKVASRTEAADLGATFVRFENGVKLTVKPTTFRDDQVLVRVRIGHGLQDLPKDRVTTAWAARGAYIEGGLKDLTSEEEERILASNIYGAEFSTADDAFLLQGSTRPEDLALQLQVLAAHATAPGFRPEAFQRMRTYMSTLHDQLEATPGGVLSRELGLLMHGGDKRYAFPTPEQVSAATPEEFKSVLAGPLAAGQIEVVIVGDTTVEKAIAVTAATFGALPPRPGSPPLSEADRTVPLPAPSPTPVLLTHKGRADQAEAYAAWPTSGFFADPQEARTLRVLSQIVELRLTEDLREAAGDTYSPQAGATSSLAFTNYGYVSAAVEIPPGKLDDFYRDLAKISADLRGHEVSADELERAKKPLVEGLLKSRQTNEYWMEQLAGAQDEPRRLEAVRGVLESLARVDAAQIRKAAQRYLTDDRIWRLQITPGAMATQAGTSQAGSAPAG